jgi:hypothetical protein
MNINESSLLYEEYYDWLASNDEVQAFLIEFFDIQTRFNAIKVYVKYLAEFEMIFDNQEKKVDLPKSSVLNSKKLPFQRKNSIQSKITLNTFSKDTDEFSNSVLILLYLSSSVNLKIYLTLSEKSFLKSTLKSILFSRN